MISVLLYGLASVIGFVLDMLMLVIFLSAIISWFNADPYNRYVQMVHALTEPLYRPFRKWTSQLGGPIDFSPMIVILIVIFLKSTVPKYLIMLSYSLQ